MKIALFAGGLWIGGGTTFVLDLGGFLRQAGHEVVVVTCERGAWWPRLAELGLPGVCLAPARWESAAHHARRLAAYFAGQQFDVLFLNNGMGVRPAQLGIHLLPDSMAVIPILHNDLHRVYAHATLNTAAWNVAAAGSPKVQNTAAKLLPHKRVLHIPYGIAVPPVAELEKREGWSLPLRLLFVGGLRDHQKGIFRLPSIVAACNQRRMPVRLTIIGDGQDCDRLASLFAQQGLLDQVEMRGSQPLSMVYQAMQTHHVLLFPSNYEGFPLVPLEAQANGCVPVLARLPGITDSSVDEGKTGLLAARDDIDGYATHIAYLLDAARWQAMSQAGIERARARFSVAAMGEQYLQLLQDLARGQYPLARSRRTISGPFTWRDQLPQPVRNLIARLKKSFRAKVTAAGRFRRLFGWRGVYFYSRSRLGSPGRVITVRPAGWQKPLYLRTGTSDLAFYEQIILQRAYDLPLAQPPQVIVDAGANIGLTSRYLARRYPAARIFAIEPEPSNYAMLCRNAAGFPNIIPIQAALWGEETRLELYNPQGRHGAFRVRPGEAAAQQTTEDAKLPGRVRAITMGRLLAEHRLEKVDLLKVDIEGSERAVFARSAGWIGLVSVIAAELHDAFEPGCRASFESATQEFVYRTTHGEHVIVRAPAH